MLCSGLCIIISGLLTVGDFDVGRGTPLAPVTVIGLTAHLNEVLAPRPQAEDVKHLLLAGEVHLETQHILSQSV